MTTIKAPFNFVPLSDKVFYPNWANQISHDIPFEDGISGKIELEMEALSPIYVRNGVEASKMKTDNPDYLQFSSFNHDYFLPSTSVKGMIRNVLEVMTFSKMPVDARKKYAQRDWNNKELYTLKSPEEQAQIHCGWLQQVGDVYKVFDCDFPYRISQKFLDDYLKSKSVNPFFEKDFCETSSLNLNKIQEVGRNKIDPKSARYKYERLGSENQKLLENISFEIDEDTANEYMPKRSKIVKNGSKVGTIVLTGQPDRWKQDRKNNKRAGKFYEFIFSESSKSIKISDLEVEQFKFMYKDSEDWKYWNKKLLNGQKIPVFFRVSGKGKDEKLKDMGFALLYKLPYEHSVKDIVDTYQKTEKEKIDLSQAILGFTAKEKSLKGRVQFSHAFASKDTVSELPEVTTALGSPKASYYPLYIRQYGQNNHVAQYATFNDGIISGWKRYPVKKELLPGKSAGDKLDSKFKPLNTGVKFKSIITFHNLKKIELGALLSSLTFHGHESDVCHSIGMAKPLGYGKLKVNSCRLMGDSQADEHELMAHFEKQMNIFLCQNWIASEPINELLSMGYSNHGVSNDELNYMKIEMKGPNEFEESKKAKDFFKPFSKLTKQNPIITSIYENHKDKLDAIEIALKEAKENELARLNEEKLRELALVEEKRKQEEEKLKNAKAESLLNTGPSFLSEVPDFERAKGRMDQWLKQTKNELLPEMFHKLLFTALIRFYNEPKNRDKKKWAEPFAKNPIWKKVASWVSSDLAQKWYNSIIK